MATRTREVTVPTAIDGVVRVEGGSAHAEPDGSFSVRADDSRSKSITLHCPAGSDVSVGTPTGKVETSGQLGAVCIVTESGKIRIEHADRVDVRARSGSVGVDACTGECRLVTFVKGVAEPVRTYCVEIPVDALAE